MGWDQRFLSSTRGQIVALLRRASRTVDELAQQLGLTDNAVRAHLATLERDGLVRTEGVRRGTRRPASAYGLTTEAEQLFSKAYGAVLCQLVGVLSDRLGADATAETLRETGRRLAAGQPVPAAPRARLAAAVDVLNNLGGLAELHEQPDGAIIRGYSCPLALVTAEHPSVCQLAAELVAVLTGEQVSIECETGATPRCRFRVHGTAMAEG